MEVRRRCKGSETESADGEPTMSKRRLVLTLILGLLLLVVLSGVVFSQQPSLERGRAVQSGQTTTQADIWQKPVSGSAVRSEA
jgi:hypothetical protein